MYQSREVPHGTGEPDKIYSESNSILSKWWGLYTCCCYWHVLYFVWFQDFVDEPVLSWLDSGRPLRH